MGHSSLALSFDPYGHLLPGSDLIERERLDAFLAEAVEG
jgi:hypothetical protein